MTEIKKERIDYLSKKSKIIQYEDYYSVSTDTFLLADFTKISKSSKKRIMELCSGSGAISILLREKSNAEIHLMDIQDDLIELAKKNIELNNMENIYAQKIDIKEIQNFYKPSSFDYVVCNPPYFPVDTMPNLKDKNNHSISRHEILCDLNDVLKSIKYLLKQNGKFFMVHRTYRLLDIINTCQQHKLAVKRIRFVYSKKSSDTSKIVLLEGSVSKVNDIKVEQPLYIYDEASNYTDEMLKIYGLK